VNARLPFLRCERLAPAPFFAGLAIAAAFLAAPHLPAPIGGPGEARRFAVFCGAAVFLLLTFHFERLAVVVTPEALVVGFRALKVRTPLAELRSASLERAAALDLGATLRRGGAWPLTVRGGPAVRVRRRRGADLLFSCGDPEGLFDALRAAGVPESALSPSEAAR